MVTDLITMLAVIGACWVLRTILGLYGHFFGEHASGSGRFKHWMKEHDGGH